MRFEKEVKDIIYRNIQKEEYRDERNSLNKITNRLFVLILELDSPNFSTYIRILSKSFSENEFKKYKEIILKSSSNEEFGNSEVVAMLRKFGINSDERRESYKKQVLELKELLLKLCDGDKEAFHEFNIKYKKYIYENQTYFSRYIPQGLILSFSRERENLLNIDEEIKKKLRRIDSYKAKVLISDILAEIGYLLGLRRKSNKDASELINDVKSLVEENSIEENTEDEQGNAENVDTIETLKMEINQYKSSLKLIQNSLSELSDKIKEESENEANEKIKDFFIMLNSGKYGNFLDKIPLVEETLKAIRKNDLEKDIPSEVKRVLIFIKSVIKFLKDQEITPIKEINEVFDGVAEDIALMDYVGEPFMKDEVKKMRITASGYKYKNMVISIPKVEEVKDNG